MYFSGEIENVFWITFGSMIIFGIQEGPKHTSYYWNPEAFITKIPFKVGLIRATMIQFYITKLIIISKKFSEHSKTRNQIVEKSNYRIFSNMGLSQYGPPLEEHWKIRALSHKDPLLKKCQKPAFCQKTAFSANIELLFSYFVIKAPQIAPIAIEDTTTDQ